MHVCMSVCLYDKIQASFQVHLTDSLFSILIVFNSSQTQHTSYMYQSTHAQTTRCVHLHSKIQARETFETSQHPMIWKMRDASDVIFSETETGHALGELRKIDPSFDVMDLVQDVEEYMIPVVINSRLTFKVFNYL